MDANEANAIWLKIHALQPQLDEILHAIDNLRDDEERQRWRRSWAEIVGSIYIELKRPIIKEFPELELKT